MLERRAAGGAIDWKAALDELDVSILKAPTGECW
jgi:hypothetical protein